jgi:hypothetical protein
LKLHLPRRISRFIRRLRRKGIHNSVAVSRDLASLGDDTFAYLPDAMGVVYGEGKDAWGFLVREETPRPERSGRTLVPCFALYAGDARDPQHVPLIVQLIRHHRASPEEFLVEHVLIPIVVAWTRAVRTRGLLLEMHGQNTLIELDRELYPRRVVYRDCDVWVDETVRREVGLPSDFRDVCIGRDAHDPPEAHYSLVFDHFLGRELFDYLVAAVSRFFPLDARSVRERAKAAVYEVMPEADRRFPRGTTFYFADEVDPNNRVSLVESKTAPRWR